MRDRELKMCVVGSPAAGKTCLIIRYTENTFPEGNPPTVVDVTSVPVALTERVFLFLVGTTLAEMNQSFATTNIPWCQHTVRHAPTTYSSNNEFLPELYQYIPEAVRTLEQIRFVYYHITSAGKTFYTFTIGTTFDKKLFPSS